jgi:hypothetical protein
MLVLNATFKSVFRNNLVSVLTYGPKYVTVTHLLFRVVSSSIVDDFGFIFFLICGNNHYFLIFDLRILPLSFICFSDIIYIYIYIYIHSVV